ncbi:MAG TPA: peptidylprolyl isomerase [Candidatus Krumholzibacteria bacterium]|nr:peptidylprolyl isomerase [Candidatus Krumholzibacteria bacterium]
MPPIVLIAVIALAFGVACEHRSVGHTTQDNGPVVARVDGHPLYRRDLEAFMPESERSEITAEDRSTSFRRWLSTQLLYDEANRNGLQLSRDVDWKLEQYRRDLIADRLVQEVLNQRAVVTRDEVMAYYRAHHDEFNLEVRVSHILTNTLEQAEQARAMLKTRPFSWVVSKMSVDKHTGPGGDLGYLSKGNMPPEFEKVVFKMHVGDVSEIVESEFGYHILKLTDVRPSLNELPFESVAQEISRQLLLHKREAVYDSLLTALAKKAKVEVVDPDLRYALELADSLGTMRAVEDTTGQRGFTQVVPEPAPIRSTAIPDSVDGGE